jgi:thiol-disulfide isomerase/thioredoxin
VGNLAPDFTAQPVDAAAWSLAAHRGQVVLLDLMGVNCDPCKAEMPELTKVAAAHANDTNLSMLSIDLASIYPSLGARSAQDIRDFKAQYHATWPFASDPGSVGRDYEALALPTSVVVGPDGVIHAKHTQNFIPASELEASIAQARSP